MWRTPCVDWMDDADKRDAANGMRTQPAIPPQSAAVRRSRTRPRRHRATSAKEVDRTHGDSGKAVWNTAALLRRLPYATLSISDAARRYGRSHSLLDA